jgi:hypothetical protein
MKKILGVLLTLLVVCQCVVPAFAKSNTLTLDSSYYMVEESSIGQNSLSVIKNEESVAYFEEIQKTTGYDIVSTATKEVYVIETLDEQGVISESRFMTNDEVDEFSSKVSTGVITADPVSTMSNIYVGEDGGEHQGGKLTISLVVYRDASRNYYAYGTADWYNGIYWALSGKNIPSIGYDFIGITWGGNGELKNVAKSFSGIYQYDKGSIPSSKASSDTYAGYVWQFDEKYDLIYCADYIDVYAKLQKTYSTYKGKETNIKLTYIHTYQETTGAIDIGVDSSGIAGGISLSSCEKQWHLEVDVPGITY